MTRKLIEMSIGYKQAYVYNSKHGKVRQSIHDIYDYLPEATMIYLVFDRGMPIEFNSLDKFRDHILQLDESWEYDEIIIILTTIYRANKAMKGEYIINTDMFKPLWDRLNKIDLNETQQSEIVDLIKIVGDT